jgi:hypothetical protein
MSAEMERIEKPRRKQRIEIVYEAEMPAGQARWFHATIYGADDPIE